MVDRKMAGGPIFLFTIFLSIGLHFRLTPSGRATTVGKQTRKAPQLIFTADAPHRGFIAARVFSHLMCTFALANGQHDTGTLHLVGGQIFAARNPAQHRVITGQDCHLAGFPTTHGTDLLNGERLESGILDWPSSLYHMLGSGQTLLGSIAGSPG
jgi:hypothetical protein